MFIVTGALVAGCTLATVALAATVPYVQTFDGTPATPLPYARLTDFGVAVHDQAQDQWAAPPPFQAQHDADCAAPPATHLVTTYAETVFQRNGHVMTSQFADGNYSVTYLSAPALVDF